MEPAIGIIETCGMAAALVVADVLSKSANVEVTGLVNTDAGRISVLVQGSASTVQAAINSTVKALSGQPGITILGHHVIPRSDEAVHGLSTFLPQASGSGSTMVEWLDD